MEKELEEHKAEGHVADEKSITELMDNAIKRLSNAEEAFAKNDFGNAFGQANAAKQLIKNAEGVLEKTVEQFEAEEEEHEMEEKAEIEVEIEEGGAEVKIEVDCSCRKSKEIAEVVGKSEANCKMIFSRSLSKLRDMMPLLLYSMLLMNFK